MGAASSSLLGGGAARKQIVLFGLSGAGKTTLLYKLKLPHWKEIQRDLAQLKEKGEDPGYHYEELDGHYDSYGLWDIPGSEEMISMWPTFYRYIQISAVLFVVNGDENDETSIIQSRRLITKLMNEDELRSAAFVCVLNFRDAEGHFTPLTHGPSQILSSQLGAKDLEDNSSNFKVVTLNCGDPNTHTWHEVEQFIKGVHSANFG